MAGVFDSPTTVCVCVLTTRVRTGTPIVVWRSFPVDDNRVLSGVGKVNDPQHCVSKVDTVLRGRMMAI